MNNDWYFESLHVFVGTDILPTNDRDDYTVQLNHFPIIVETEGTQYTLNGTTMTPFYIIAHAQVKCFFVFFFFYSFFF